MNSDQRPAHKTLSRDCSVPENLSKVRAPSLTRLARRFLFVFAATLLLAALVNHPALAGEPDGPGIALRGSIETRKYEGLVVQGRERLVGPGDTMWGILVREKGLPANRFRSYLVIMRRLNPNKMIGETGLRVGDKLFVPLQLDQLIGARIQEASPTAPRPAPIEKGATVAYRVKRGEHLYRSIREQLKVSDERKVAEYYALVKAINPERQNWDSLSAGDRIRLPNVEASSEPQPFATAIERPRAPVAEPAPSVQAEPAPLPPPLPGARAAVQLPASENFGLVTPADEDMGGQVQNSGEEAVGLIVGQRFRVRGSWSGDRLTATRLQDRDPSVSAENGKVEGRIEELDVGAQSLRIGPFMVRWDATTRFLGITAAQLKVGETIEVSGKLAGPLRLSATEIERADEMSAGSLNFLGTVSEERIGSDGSMDLTILGLRVAVTRTVYNRASALTKRPDDRRPEDQFAFNLFGRPVTIGGDLESVWRYRGDYRLRKGARDDFSRLEGELQLEAFYPFAENYSLFLESKINYEGEFGRGSDDRRPKWELARGESWLFASNLFGSNFSAQIGRQNIREDRGWWWDDDLDALRVHFDRRGFHAELAVAQDLIAKSTRERRIDADEKNVFRLLGQTAWSWARDQILHGFVLFHNDHSARHSVGQLVNEDRFDDSDARLVWLGGRSTGRVGLGRLGKLDYSLDAAWVVGRETVFDDDSVPGDLKLVTERLTRTVNGWGLDSSLKWEIPLWIEPTLSLGYAVGFGDRNPNDGRDGSFRQTGLQENKARFGGVYRLRYYGELLRPELSNLQIWSGALGIRFWRSSSIEFVYHYYRQVHAADFLRDVAIKADPMGRRLSIGHEWDAIVGLREWKHVDLKVIGGFFRAGDAFGALKGKTAFTSLLQFTFNF